MMKTLFVYWLAIMPFILTNRMYEGAKLIWFYAGVVVLIVYWIGSLRNKIAKVIGAADYFYFCFIAILLVASINGVHPWQSIVGGSYRHQGVIFFLGVWLVGKTIDLLLKQKKLLVKLFSASLVIESLLLVFQKQFSWGLVNARPIGTFGEANAAGGFLAIAAFFASSWWVFTAVGIAIILTNSRSASLAFLFVFVGKILTSKLKVWSKQVCLSDKLFLILVVSLVTGLVFYQARNARTNLMHEDRLLFWDMGLEAVSQRPILGYGAESNEVVFGELGRKWNLNLDFMIDRSHNLFFDIAIWAGIPGLIVFCLWLVVSFKKIALDAQMALAGFLVFAFLQPLGVVHWILLFSLLTRYDFRN